MACGHQEATNKSFLFPIGYVDVDQLQLCGHSPVAVRYSGAHYRCPRNGSRALPQCALIYRFAGFLKQSEIDRWIMSWTLRGLDRSY
jgi:hypothetical protein